MAKRPKEQGGLDDSEESAGPARGRRQGAKAGAAGAAADAARPTLPPSFFGARALFLILRLGASRQPIRLTFIAAPSARDDDVVRLFTHPTWRCERRAPGVFDVELPSDRLEDFVATHHALFRKVDAPGWLFGETVRHDEDRAEVTIAIDEPTTLERKRDLNRVGFHMVGEGPGEVRGVVLGKDLAGLVAEPWIGPVEVRKIHPHKE